MNPTNQFFKKQGLKVFLPLLLLATACGEGTTSSSFQADLNPDETAPVAVSSGSGLKLGEANPAAGVPAAPAVTIPEAEKPTLAKVLPPSPTQAPAKPTTSGGLTPGGATQVPEPTALAGLAIAAAGIVVVKRKQQAA